MVPLKDYIRKCESKRDIISWIYLEVYITALEVLYRNMARS